MHKGWKPNNPHALQLSQTPPRHLYYYYYDYVCVCVLIVVRLLGSFLSLSRFFPCSNGGEGTQTLTPRRSRIFVFFFFTFNHFSPSGGSSSSGSSSSSNGVVVVVVPARRIVYTKKGLSSPEFFFLFPLPRQTLNAQMTGKPHQGAREYEWSRPRVLNNNKKRKREFPSAKCNKNDGMKL